MLGDTYKVITIADTWCLDYQISQPIYKVNLLASGLLMGIATKVTTRIETWL